MGGVVGVQKVQLFKKMVEKRAFLREIGRFLKKMAGFEQFGLS